MADQDGATRGNENNNKSGGREAMKRAENSRPRAFDKETTPERTKDGKYSQRKREKRERASAREGHTTARIAAVSTHG